MPSITVKDASNVTQTINTLPNLGVNVSANALPVVLATDSPALPVLGNVSVTSGNIAVTSGNIAVTSGNIAVTSGNIIASQGAANISNPWATISPPSTQLALTTPQLGGAAIPVVTYGGVQLQIANLNADSLAVTHSTDGVNYVTATLLKHDLSQVVGSAITGSANNGIYSVMVFGGYLKVTRTGTADTTLAVSYRGTN